MGNGVDRTPLASEDEAVVPAIRRDIKIFLLKEVIFLTCKRFIPVIHS